MEKIEINDENAHIKHIQVVPTLKSRNAEHEFSQLDVVPSKDFTSSMLKALHNEFDKYIDLPVFCCDGVVGLSKFVLSASSSFMKDLLSNTVDAEVCLVIPDVNVSEVSIFRAAILSDADRLKANPAINKVGQLLKIDVGMTLIDTSRETDESFVDYSSILGDEREMKKIFKMLHKQHSRISSAEKLSHFLGASSFSCQDCQRSFVDDQSMKRHKALVHSIRSIEEFQPLKLLQCRFCDRKFSLTVSLNQHIFVSHSKDKNSEIVEQTKMRNDLDRHLSIVDDKEVKFQERKNDLICNTCGFSARTWKQLDIHLMNHTEQRPFRCSTCQKGFKEFQKLERHQVIHTGLRDFKCKFCGKAFGLLHNMKTHEKVHLGQGHRCDYCGKIYSQKSGLKQHELLHRRKRHKPSTDSQIQFRQRLNVGGRGRPSLAEIFEKTSHEHLSTL